MIYKAASVFTGYETFENYAVEVVKGKISDIMPFSEIPSGASVVDCGSDLLVPAFVDIQLYGAGKRLLSVYPDAKTVEAIVAYCRTGGAAWCLPTVATVPIKTIEHAVDAVKEYKNNGGTGVIGLHVEGPWINPVKRGAHKEEWIHVPTEKEIRSLLEYGKDIIKLITLAPEIVSPPIIDLIQSYGVVVSAGHSNATYEEATAAFDNNVQLATHLFNAMSALQHRSPGMVGAIFQHGRVLCSVVPDGYHVDFAAVQIAKKIMGDRLFAITDAVTETTDGYYRHVLDGDKYTSNGILSGSALTMHKAFKNLVQHCHVSVEEALRMCSLYPAKALHMENEIGVIKKGADASLLLLSRQLELQNIITEN